MGPLVPDLITNELNLVVALLVGIAFGYILEQAGFSSSRKLTGLFYGTDFTVLRVFFTAGLTAMTGVLLLSKTGRLDASVIYVNPTFVHSALVGGAIMGVGFVVGGYCPGTSFCAAAVGRIDGMMFVAGGLGGVFAFGEAFPRVRSFYQAGSMGDVTVPSLLGISPGVFAVAMIAVAVIAFVLTGRIETHVNPQAPARTFPVRRHRLAAAVLLGAGVLAALWPDYHARLLATAADAGYRRSHAVERMTADELAFRIIDRDPSLLLIDVRPGTAFAGWTLPGAVHLPPADLFGRDTPAALAQVHRRKIFFAEDEIEAEKAAALAQLLGYKNVGILGGGLNGFRSTILAPSGPQSTMDDVHAFRADAARQIADLSRGRRLSKAAGSKPRKIAGGCGL